MERDAAARAGDVVVSQDAAEAPPLSADQINQLLNDVAEDVYARAEALAKRVDELGEVDFADPAELRARLVELARLEEELSVEFETRLMELDAMVLRRLAVLRAGGDDAAAPAASGGVEVYSLSATEADVFDAEDRSDDQDSAAVTLDS